MKLKRLIAVVAACAAVGGVAALSQIGNEVPRAEASDHDDGESDVKARALNLTDHFAFKSPADPNKLSLVMYFNPRSLPGKQYFLSSNARYEFHVSKITSRTLAPTLKDDFVFRFEGGAPTASGTQFITLSVFRDNELVGQHVGTSTSIAASRAGVIVNNGGAAGLTIAATPGFNYFVGQRADSFFFDVNRFFQVRAFLAQRFFGGTGGIGDKTAGLAPNCEGDTFLQGITGTDLDGDAINLFNPPTCAPDFTKNVNVTAIVLNVPKVFLGGGDIYDTWSTISVAQ